MMLFCSTMFGQEYYFTPVEQGEYNQSMTLITTISYEGVEQEKSSIELGIFCGDKCRATVIMQDYYGKYLAWVDIKGKSGDVFTFKVYDHEDGTIKDNYILTEDGNELPEVTLSFIDNFVYGSFDHPYGINFIAPNYYIPEIGDFETNMTVAAIVKIDGIEQKNKNLELGAFVGDKVRGSSKTDFIYTISEERYYAYPLIIAGNDDEIVTFKLYDHSTGIELDFLKVNSVNYEANEEIGTIAYPLEVNFITKVAQVGEIKYETLQEAVEAAENGQTVTLLTDATGPGVEIKKDITIDLNGHDYIVSEGAFDISAVVRLQNGTGTFTHATEGANVVNIKNGAQLYLQEGINGTMTKSVVGTGTGWGTISSPVGNVEHVNVTGLLSEEGTHDLYRYNETTEFYENVKAHSEFDNLEAGRGYLYANTANTDVIFSGLLNTVAPEDLHLSYTAEKSLAGFNLIGNPYTHNIDETHFALSDVDAQLSKGFYVISGEGAWTAKATNAKIAPMESVFVKTNKAADLTINKAATPKSRSANNGMLSINVSNEQYGDVAYVSFNEGLGLDKISHRNSEIPMVYVPVEGVDYAIAMMNRDVTEIPVSFKAMTMGEYTISAEGIDCEFSQMTLVDRMTGVETNLLLDDYNFMAKSGDNTERFIIRLQHSANANTTSENFVYVNNDELIINNIEGASVVRILDVLGRPVAEYNVYESANISTASFRSGVYMVQMTGESGVKVQKIIID